MIPEPSNHHTDHRYFYTSQIQEEPSTWLTTSRSTHLDPAQKFPHGYSQQASIDPQINKSDSISGATALSVPPSQNSASTQDRQALVRTTDSISTSHSPAVLSSNTPAHRLLPSQDVTDDTIDDAYVAFILSCNPSIPLETDTAELRRTFRAPPKSDSKAFSIFRLFELIRKLEQKHLKTWAQLAIELGVEPPTLKGQSAQKVQQYAVRLKRWMHAMHVDAFFEYLLNKPHVYWTQIPSPGEQPNEFGRDGVPAEEDLALRALLPETRPKRGRRKVEEKSNDEDQNKSPAQRPRLNSPIHSEEFATPRSALPGGITSVAGRADHVESDHLVPWSTSDARVSFVGHSTISTPVPLTPQDQWQSKGAYQNLSAYPHSAITPRSTNLFMPFEDEPRSAITPTKGRQRKRHGPTVSSAWPSSGNSSGAKLRGRPPSNRNVSDGPFSTFPANPSARVGPPINLRDQTPAATPTVERLPGNRFSINESTSYQRPQNGKPRGLSLQVPERLGGAVRLATPPPTVLLNGEIDRSDQGGNVYVQNPDSVALEPYLKTARLDENVNIHCTPTPSHPGSSGSKPVNDGNSISDEEYRKDVGNGPNEDRTNVDAFETDFVHALLRAEWSDVDGNRLDRCSLEEAVKMVKQLIRDLRAGASSKETFLINLSALAGGQILTHDLRVKRLESTPERTAYLMTWCLKYGTIEGSMNIKIDVENDSLSDEIVEPVTTGEDFLNEEGNETAKDEVWRQRYLNLYHKCHEREIKVRGLRKSVLEALVATRERGIIGT